MQNEKKSDRLAFRRLLAREIKTDMKKRFLLLIFFAVQKFLFAFSADDIKHFTLENGLEIYFLQDISSPVIHLELDVKAGFSRQTEKNAGYFSFYAKMKGAEAGADIVSFTKTASPDGVEKAILELSEVMRPISLSDDELKTQIENTKNALEKYFSEPAGFINSAIDSKIFPENPWKRSSGAVPSLFEPKSAAESRTILSSIAKNYYTPSNSMLFVSGNITENSVLELAEKYFGEYGGISRSQKIEKKSDENGKKSSNFSENLLESQKSSGVSKSKQKRFVIHDKSFADEMTQICVQYKNLGKNETEILSEIWNDNESVFKKTLLRQRNLKILGAEYIDASSAKDSMAARLIIQSLLGIVKVNPVVQADLFLSKSREDEEISDEMIQNAVKKRKAENLKIYENSAKLMANLAAFVSNCDEEDKEDKIAAFFNQNEKLGEISAENLQQAVQNEEPYVFVLVNSNVYNKNAKNFKNAGYNVITSKNALWFQNPEYKNLFAKKEIQNAQKNFSLQEDILKSADRFIQKSKSEIAVLSLENEIPVVLKQNPNSSQVEASLISAGGDLLCADKTPRLASVLTGAIAANIRNQLDLFAANGAISKDSYEVRAKTSATQSVIDTIIPAKNLNFAFQAMYTALIFCDITPATADMMTYDERTKWRLKSGTAEFQLLCNAMRILYKDTKYPKLFEDEKDKPADMNFTKILEAYPSILDATRFSFAVTGGFSDQGKLLSYLNKTFGTLETHPETRIFETGLPKTQIKETEKKFALRHLFLTDIPKEKAGPMPAILIPTTKFLDPVLYCISSPDISAPDSSLFNALLLEIGKKMNEKAAKAGSESKVKIALPEADIPFARIFVSNVERTSGADKIYKESVDEIKSEIRKQLELKTEGVFDLEKNELLARLENNWITEVLPEAGTNEGLAELVKSSFILGNPNLYLEQYNSVDKASLEDYFLIAESYFSDKPPMRLYSKDSNK